MREVKKAFQLVSFWAVGIIIAADGFAGEENAAPPPTENTGVYEKIDFSPNRYRISNYAISRNLVQNPSFEDGFDYWAFDSLGALSEMKNGEHFSIDESGAWHGKRSLKIRREKGLMPSPPVTFAMPTEPRAQYTFSFYAKTDKADQPLNIHGVTGIWGEFVGVGFNIDSKEWKRYSFSFTAPNKCVALCLGLNPAPDDGNIWIDGVQLEKNSSVSEFVSLPTGVSLVTARRENLFQPGEKTDAKLRIWTEKPDTGGTVELIARDFFLKEIKKESKAFRSGSNGLAAIPLEWADSLESGLFIIETRLKLDEGFENRYFHRIAKMNFLSNTHRLKNLFSAGATDNRMGNWERKFELWKKIGVGSSIHFDPPPHQYAEIMKKNNVFSFSTIFSASRGPVGGVYGAWAISEGPGKGRIDLAKEDFLNLSDDDLKQIEETAFRVASEYPEIGHWKFVNEPVATYIGKPDYFKALIKALDAARKGTLRANPKAVMISPDPCNMSPTSGIRYIEAYLQAGGGDINEIIAIHPYRERPEQPDLDADTKTFIDMVDKYKPGCDIWFTEGIYHQNHHIPSLMLNVEKGVSTDHYRGGYFSYDLGLGERRNLAYAMRSWLVGLKYSDRVKLYVDWGIANHFYYGIDMLPAGIAFASNTLGNILGDAKFITDIDYGEFIRAYVFEDAQTRPVLAIWTYSLEIDRELGQCPKLRITNLPGSYEIIDCVGKSVQKNGNEKVTLSGYPVFIRGEKGSSKDFISAMSKTKVDGAVIRQVSVFAGFTADQQAKIQVKNLLSREISGQLKILSDGKVVYDEKLVLPPKGSSDVVMTVGKPSETLKNLAYRAEFIADGMETPEFANIDLEYFPCKETGNAITIDGSLEDWKGYTPIKLERQVVWEPSVKEGVEHPGVPAHGGDKDLGARLRTAWDKDNLYMAFDVSDDKQWNMDDINNAWKGDSIQLYFDSFGDGKWTTLRGYDSNDQTYDVWFKDGKIAVYRRLAPEAQLGFLKPGAVPEIKSAFVKTAGGYIVELAFPLRQIAPIQLREGDSFGFSVIVNDHDGDYRKRGLILNGGGSEPHLNPHLYPQLIMVK
jgi:hypothetical protein